MNTDQLINALAADAEASYTPIRRILWVGAGIGTLAAAALFFILLPVRPDLAAVLSDWHFLMKWVFSLTLLASAMAMIASLACPQWSPNSKMLILLGAPLALAIGVIAELATLPSSSWMPTLIGSNAFSCLLYLPLLSSLPLAVMIIALRRGAPQHAALTGAIAGLAAAGIAATFYAAHCQDDSPLFLMAWYVLATVIVAAIGALLGALLLRW